MKKFTILITVIFTAFLVFSCDFLGNNNPPEETIFWAQNLETDEYYNVKAELLVQGTYCDIWVEKNTAGISDAKKVQAEFDGKIYPKVMKYFGVQFEDKDTGLLFDAMDYTKTMVGGDGKVTILLLDIKDGYIKGEKNTYTAGYFWAANFLKKDPSHPQLKYSNERTMIYVDTYPGLDSANIEETFITIAHEFQHLLNSVTTVLLQRNTSMDTWIDEGLSAAAERVYSGKHSQGRLEWYEYDPTGLIAKGNNFYVWGNRANEDINSTLDDYATVYLFFQWLKLMTELSEYFYDPDYGPEDVYYSIIASDYYDYRAITNAADYHIYGIGGAKWEDLLELWLASNYVKDSDEYGYGSDFELNNLKNKKLEYPKDKYNYKVHYAPGSSGTIPLFPGEGVYSYADEPINNITVPVKNNIKVIGLTDNGPEVNILKGDALLTFNVNTAITGTAQPGEITGKAPPQASIMTDIVSRSAFYAFSSGPFPISASDMLRRNGFTPRGNISLSGSISSRSVVDSKINLDNIRVVPREERQKREYMDE